MDTVGRLWAVDVHTANEADGPASIPLINDILCYGERVEKVSINRSYEGVFANKLSKLGIDAPASRFKMAFRPESAQGFVSVAKHWPSRLAVVERSIAWTNPFV